MVNPLGLGLTLTKISFVRSAGLEHSYTYSVFIAKRASAWP